MAMDDHNKHPRLRPAARALLTRSAAATAGWRGPGSRGSHQWLMETAIAQGTDCGVSPARQISSYKGWLAKHSLLRQHSCMDSGSSSSKQQQQPSAGAISSASPARQISSCRGWLARYSLLRQHSCMDSSSSSSSSSSSRQQEPSAAQALLARSAAAEAGWPGTACCGSTAAWPAAAAAAAAAVNRSACGNVPCIFAISCYHLTASADLGAVEQLHVCQACGKTCHLAILEGACCSPMQRAQIVVAVHHAEPSLAAGCRVKGQCR